MTRYILTHKLYSKFMTLEYNMACKICSVPIQTGDEVESKSGGYNQPKLYHAKCYDESHNDTEYTLEKISKYSREDLEDILVDEFETPLPDNMSNVDLIEFILLKELEWITDSLK